MVCKTQAQAGLRPNVHEAVTKPRGTASGNTGLLSRLFRTGPQMMQIAGRLICVYQRDLRAEFGRLLHAGDMIGTA